LNTVFIAVRPPPISTFRSPAWETIFPSRSKLSIYADAEPKNLDIVAEGVHDDILGKALRPGLILRVHIVAVRSVGSEPAVVEDDAPVDLGSVAVDHALKPSLPS